MPANKWDSRFMDLADAVARWSKDPDEGVGALLVSPDRRNVSWGFNGFPRRMADSSERLLEKEVRRRLTVHAELNALLNCPTHPEQWTLYVTKHPCHECAKAIVQADVYRVVCPDFEQDSSWAPSCRLAREILREAGVILDLWRPYIKTWVTA